MGEADKLDGARKCSGRSLEQSLKLPDYQMECGLVGSGHVRRAAGTHQGRCDAQLLPNMAEQVSAELTA